MWDLIALHCFWILYLQPEHLSRKNVVAVSKYNILLQKMESAFAPNGLYRRVHDKDWDYNHHSPYSEYDDKSSAANPLRKVPLVTIFYRCKWL